jgi:hypothetical protein
VEKTVYLKVIALFGALLGMFTTASAQSTIGRFLLLPPSAASASMGGSGVALDASPFASYFNAAGLAYSPTVSIGGSFVRPLPFFGNIGHSYFTGLVRVNDIGTIAVSANLYWKGHHLRTPPSTFLPASDDLMDWHLKLSFARSFSEDIAGGISLGVLRLTLADFGTAFEEGRGKSTSVLFNGGVIFRNQLLSATFVNESTAEDNPVHVLADSHSHKGISIGLALANIGPKVTMIDAAQADPLPSTLIVGVAYSPVRTIPIGLMVTADAENQFSEGSTIDNLHWGGELVVLELFALRGGYFQDISGPKTSYWTWGAGLRFRFLHLNFARYTRALLPSWHFDGTFSWEFQ